MREITVGDLAVRLEAGEPTLLIDVRNPWEREICALPASVPIPLHELPERGGEIRAPEGALIVAYCHHGVRSLQAAMFLAREFGIEGVVSMAGGIDAWSREVDPTVPRY